MPKLKQIITSFVYPPIGTRSHDWCAYYEDHVEDGDYGWGPTEEEAIVDLIQCYDLEHKKE